MPLPTPRVVDSINPATGEVIARVRAAGADDYERVMKSAAAAFAAWRDVPAPRRGEAVRLMGEALRAKKDLLGSLVSLEMGKIKAEGDGEVQEMIDIADFAVGQSRMLYGLSMHSERPRHRMYEQWHPLGVVGVISAFNFPVAVWSWNAFIAAVCGDISVWKPSHHTPLCAIAVQKICNEVIEAQKLPPIFQLFIPADNALASRFVDDQRVALVSFTGSTQVGRHVGERVASRLGRSLLELGGNNAIIVDEYANLDLVVPAVLFGAVGTAGQRCTTTRRLLVHASRIDEVERRLVASYKQVRIGNPLDPKTLMGPLVGASAVRQYEAALDDARKQGGEVLCGGRTMPGPGYFVEPTIVRARQDMAVVKHETFAPILYLVPFKTSTRRSRCTTTPTTACRPRSSRTVSSTRSGSCRRPAATAASRTSTSAPRAPRSAARSAAKRTREAAASRAPTPGRSTCGARPTRSIIRATCRSRRASSST